MGAMQAMRSEWGDARRGAPRREPDGVPRASSYVKQLDTQTRPPDRRGDRIVSALAIGSAASVSSAAMLAACSRHRSGSAFAALNGPSQWLWGEREAGTTRATLRHTLTGYLIHHSMSIFWAGVHERVFRGGGARDEARHEAAGTPAHAATRRLPRKSAVRHLAEATLTTATAYFIDYHLIPRRFRPGFRKHLDPSSIFAGYAAFAAGLAYGALQHERMHRELRRVLPEPGAGSCARAVQGECCVPIRRERARERDQPCAGRSRADALSPDGACARRLSRSSWSSISRSAASQSSSSWPATKPRRSARQ